MQAHRTLDDLLRAKSRILVFSGAGISTASGIPDFRGPKGVWKTKQPVYYQDFMSSDAARVEYWSQKLEGWEQFRSAEPNAVHRAVVRLDRAGKLDLCVTQNIDGLHRKAGLDSHRIVELHGTNSEVECQSCRARTAPEPAFETFRSSGAPPRCACGGWLKPATISFGQSLREGDIERAMLASRSCDLVIALGSTLGVYPAAAVPLEAVRRGASYVIINRGATEHDELGVATLRLEGDVGEIFAPSVERALT